MMLPPKSREHYWGKGWLVVNDVYGPDAVRALTELAMEVAHRDLDAAQAAQADHDADGTVAPRKIHRPFVRDERFREFALAPALQDLLRQLLGESPLLATDQIFMKPPKFGSAKPYHQDNYYFRCTPPDHVITAWIALDDVDESNGCLRYIDGSHREGILPHTPVPGEEHNLAVDDALIDFERESLAEVRQGGVVFHHSEVLHTSHRNRSERWRRAYATHWVTADVTSESQVIDNAYYRLDIYPPGS